MDTAVDEKTTIATAPHDFLHYFGAPTKLNTPTTTFLAQLWNNKKSIAMYIVFIVIQSLMWADNHYAKPGISENDPETGEDIPLLSFDFGSWYFFPRTYSKAGVPEAYCMLVFSILWAPIMFMGYMLLIYVGKIWARALPLYIVSTALWIGFLMIFPYLDFQTEVVILYNADPQESVKAYATDTQAGWNHNSAVVAATLCISAMLPRRVEKITASPVQLLLLVGFVLCFTIGYWLPLDRTWFDGADEVDYEIQFWAEYWHVYDWARLSQKNFYRSATNKVTTCISSLLLFIIFPWLSLLLELYHYYLQKYTPEDKEKMKYVHMILPYMRVWNMVPALIFAEMFNQPLKFVRHSLNCDAADKFLGKITAICHYGAYSKESGFYVLLAYALCYIGYVFFPDFVWMLRVCSTPGWDPSPYTNLEQQVEDTNNAEHGMGAGDMKIDSRDVLEDLREEEI